MTLGKQQRLRPSTLIYLFFYSVSSVPTGNDEPKSQSVVCQTKNMFLPLQIKIYGSRYY